MFVQGSAGSRLIKNEHGSLFYYGPRWTLIFSIMDLSGSLNMAQLLDALYTTLRTQTVSCKILYHSLKFIYSKGLNPREQLIIYDVMHFGGGEEVTPFGTRCDR